MLERIFLCKLLRMNIIEVEKQLVHDCHISKYISEHTLDIITINSKLQNQNQNGIVSAPQYLMAESPTSPTNKIMAQT